MIDDKIGNDRTNEEVFAEFGHDVLPHVDPFGDANDANEDETTQFRVNADKYTPEAFDKYLNAQIVTDRGGDMCSAARLKVGNKIMTESRLDPPIRIQSLTRGNTSSASRMEWRTRTRQT